MSEVFLRKNLHSLEAIDEEGAAALRKLSHGDTVKVKITKPRNIKHHRLFWALVGIVFENQERYPSREALVAALKAATGHAELLPMPNGNMVYIPKSISFAAMDQTQFDKFFNDVCDVVCTKIIPNLKVEALKQEVMQMVGASS